MIKHYLFSEDLNAGLSGRAVFTGFGGCFYFRHCLFSLIILLSLFFLWSCASQAPPTGGPEDKIPPQVISTDPAKDSVFVSRRPLIRIEFSEPMNKPSVEQSVYISPRPLSSPDYEWEKNILIITLSDSLDTNQTCVVSVGTGAKDARQNPMKQAYTFAFSTGESIDRGEMSGSVLHSSYTGMTVWAYNLIKHDTVKKDSLVCLKKADYVTSVSEQGKFSLSYLAPGIYRLYAVIDQDQDEVYTSGVDYIGVPDGDHAITRDSNVITGMLFHIMTEDTTRFGITSLRVIDEQTVLIGFSIPLENIDSARTSSIHERFVITDLMTGDTLPVSDFFINPVHRLEIKILTGKLDSSHHYVLSAGSLVSMRGDTLPAIIDTLSAFDFYQPEQASLEWILPEQNNSMIIPDDKISVRFNKGMNRNSWDKHVALESDSLPVSMGRWKWLQSGEAVYAHDSVYLSGKKYQFVIPPDSVRDWQNLALNDTVIRFSFMSYSSDSLGTISGRLSSAFPDSSDYTYMATLRNLSKEKRSYFKRIQPGKTFQFDYVIPGKYILEAYLDLNGDQRFNTGRVIPFMPPEPYRIHQDTISARANWETAGIQFIFK